VSVEESAGAAEARDLLLAARTLLAAAKRTRAEVGDRPPYPSTLVEAEAWRVEYRLAASRVRSYTHLVETIEHTARFLGVDLLDPRLDPR
jgi:hypothetical protein